MWSEPPSSRLGRGAAGLLLVLILVAAFAVRAWYASYRLEAGRFWDERYAQANVRAIVEGGTLRPVGGYYPSPVFNLPSAAVAWAAQSLTGQSLFDRQHPARLTPRGYLLMRLLQSVYGTAAVAVLFLLGRRLFGAPLGLLAALALAFLPWHIRLSAYFKPDALLSLTTLVVLYCSLRLLESPGWRWSVATGLALAAAVGSKLTGVIAVLPLAFASLLWLRRDSRRVGYALLAGATGVVAFILSNPYWRAYPAWLANLKHDYAVRAEWHAMSRWEFPVSAIRFFVDPFTFGKAGALLALSGVALGLAGALRSRDPVRRSQLLTLAAFPLLWVGCLALQTAYFKGNNMLPVLAPLALLGLAVLLGAWRVVRRYGATLRRPAAGWLLAGSLAFFLVRPGILYVYRSLTPSTLDAAYELLGGTREVGEGRLAWVGPGAGSTLPRWEISVVRGGTMGLGLAPDTGLTARQIALADAVIVREDSDRGRQLKAPRGANRVAAGARIRRVEPILFRRRGPSLVAASRPWRRHAEPLQLALKRCATRCLEARVPGRPDGGIHGTLALWLPTRPHSPLRMPTVILAGRPLELHDVTERPDGRLFVGERFPLGGRSLRLRIRGAELPRRVAARLYLWLPPGPPAVTPSRFSPR